MGAEGGRAVGLNGGGSRAEDGIYRLVSVSSPRSLVGALSPTGDVSFALPSDILIGNGFLTRTIIQKISLSSHTWRE